MTEYKELIISKFKLLYNKTESLYEKYESVIQTLLKIILTIFVFPILLSIIYGLLLKMITGEVNELYLSLLSIITSYSLTFWVYKFNPFEELVNNTKNNWKTIFVNSVLYGFLALGFSFILSITINSFVKETENQTETVRVITTELPMFLAYFFPVVIAPLFEELYFRAFLRKCINNDKYFLVFSTIIFAVVHLQNLSSPTLAIINILSVGFSGYLFAKIYIKTNSIISGIISHAIFNAIMITLALSFKV